MSNDGLLRFSYSLFSEKFRVKRMFSPPALALFLNVHLILGR